VCFAACVYIQAQKNLRHINQLRWHWLQLRCVSRKGRQIFLIVLASGSNCRPWEFITCECCTGSWWCCMTAKFIWFYGVSDAVVWQQNSSDFMGFLMLLYDSKIRLILWGFWCCCMTAEFNWFYGLFLTLYVLKFSTLRSRESIGARLQVCFFQNKSHNIHN
jgi:hypothetical protein